MGTDRIVYYDGYCNLCSRAVQWVVRNDRSRRFRYKPLPDRGVSPDTVVLEENGKRYERSSAALRIAVQLRFPWPLLGVFWIVPRFIRDAVYRWIARNRIRWFGSRSTCYLPGE